MKRSEALTLIMDTFEHEGLGMQMRLKDADSILYALEMAGIKPPLSKEKGVFLVKYYGWEPEDEEK
jgi:hypothetical protein